MLQASQKADPNKRKTYVFLLFIERIKIKVNLINFAVISYVVAVVVSLPAIHRIVRWSCETCRIQ